MSTETMGAGSRQEANVPNAVRLSQPNALHYIWGLLKRNPITLLGLGGIVLVFALALAAPVIAPYAQEAMSLRERLAPPSPAHPFGTDQFGRDVLSRILFGAQVSLAVGVGSTLISLIGGVMVGAIAGYCGGWIDEILMRAMDILLAFPYIILAIALAALVGPSFGSLVLIIAVLRIAQFARVMRGAVLSTMALDYIDAAHSVGVKPLRILLRHIVPNTVTPTVVLATLSIATAINTEAALSFLGLGIQPPQSSWGTMLADGRRFIREAPWIATIPGVFISLTILAYNLAGDGLRDILDPHTLRGG